MVDLIISLDGYASAEGWPGWWGLEGPEYLAWLEQEGEKDYTFLLGANTYRVMSSMSEEASADRSGFSEDEGAALTGLDAVPKVVFSSTLQAPLTWPNSELVDRRRRRGREGDETDREPGHLVPSAASASAGRC